MSSDLSPTVQEFLDGSGRFAVVATVNPNSTPHQAVVWYLRRGQTLLVNARDGRRWAANARRTGQLSVMVAAGYDYVVLTGELDVVDDVEVGGGDIGALARRYGDDEEQFRGQRRVSFVLHPGHIALHGRLAKAAE